MEQRFIEQNKTITKQYGPKVEAVLSGVLLFAGAILTVCTFV